MNKDMCCPVCGNYIDVEEIYQQGKADQKTEDNEFFNFEGAWRLEKQKIREDAIDDCIKLVGGNVKTIVGVVFDSKIPEWNRALGRTAQNKLIEDLIIQLEQLKEQK